MNITPTLKEVQNIAAKGLYQILPVSCEILSDFTTPLETMKILKQVSTHCYLLESAVPQGQWGRYSFLGYDPKLEITCRNGNMKIGDLKLKTSHPSNYIRQIMAERKSPGFSHLPPFTGGLVGYFSYDYFGYTEPSVPGYPEDEQAFQDLDLMLFDKVIAFDHVRQKLILIVNMELKDPESGYHKAVLELEQLIRLLRTGKRKKNQAEKCWISRFLSLTRSSFVPWWRRQNNTFRKGIFFRLFFLIISMFPFKEAYSILTGFCAL